MFGIFSAIASGLSALFSGVGLSVCKAASELILSLPKALEIGKVVLQGIAEVVIKVAQILAISPENESVEEIGIIIKEVGGFREYLELVALNQKLMKKHIELE